MSEKLQKVLARVGLGSRRAMEVWIQDGRVQVNGVVATLGDRVSSGAKILVDGRPVKYQLEADLPQRVILYHKPLGEVCTRDDPEGRPTVFQNLPQLKTGRWVMVGRLDVNTTGLLLFTTSGALANCLMHPKFSIEREYAVRVFGEVDQAMLKVLKTGVVIDGEQFAFDKIMYKGNKGINQWYHVVVSEGRNRLVRKLWESQGLQVSRLTRVRYGDILLPRDLKPGQWQEVDYAKFKRYV